LSKAFSNSQKSSSPSRFSSSSRYSASGSDAGSFKAERTAGRVSCVIYSTPSNDTLCCSNTPCKYVLSRLRNPKSTWRMTRSNKSATFAPANYEFNAEGEWFARGQ
jgi:hypothetical protein